jgi:hypothetical protein
MFNNQICIEENKEYEGSGFLDKTCKMKMQTSAK